MEPTSPLPGGVPKKRSYDGQIVHGVPNDRAAAPDPFVRETSPAPSTTSSALSELTTSIEQNHASNPTEPKAKKRKLTFVERAAEKAVRAAEKEAKEKQKAEERTRREEEKRLRDEEKRRREEEKEVARRERELEKERKQQLKEADKKAKEDEKAKLEEEKQKKERSQMRIGAFFGRPTPASTPPSTPDDVSSGVSSRRSSIVSIDTEKLPLASHPSPAKSSDYEKLFPSFFVFENTAVAPFNRFTKCQSTPTAKTYPRCLPWNQDEVPVDSAGKKQIQDLLQSNKTIRPRPLQAVRDLIKQHNRSVEAALDLTSHDRSPTPLQLLEKLPVKYLAFYHAEFDLNTRPPYKGTYTRALSPRSTKKMSKNPTYRGLPNTNYDYDSEVEWEPPQEGDEDINLEDEESEDEGEDEEMEDFLDDADDVIRRRAVVRDTEAVCSGICWQGSSFDSHGIDMQEYKVDVLDDLHQFPIDPYATHYWVKVEREMTPKANRGSTHTMHPPRIPLSNVSAPNFLQLPGVSPASRLDLNPIGSENVLPIPAPKTKKSMTKPAKTIDADMLPAFKNAIEGSDLTKVGLIEILKKRFPKASKDSIKDTLNAIAVREGPKGQEKKWKLL